MVSMMNRVRRCFSRHRGFTLIELLIVLGIVALLLTLAVPRFFPSVDKSKETILLENLRNTRIVIDQYRGDNGRYPDSLEQLVEKKYLREIPYDPITESRETWVVVPPEEGEQGELYNLHSGAPGNDRNGRPYAEW
ncbi:prepilin-type N-terminal cleavage/methylation domain-containing protein [Massilia sp. ZL223]|uniref:type II secretion system protein n=1 Tax=Massilia sp. ZL223 TaxID=2824904 RepID=UPI001B8310C4|nr:prepilin-type N-terminal cleavage/methylation domain-containing protein [Massilia sp. ZL223]